MPPYNSTSRSSSGGTQRNSDADHVPIRSMIHTQPNEAAADGRRPDRSSCEYLLHHALNGAAIHTSQIVPPNRQDAFNPPQASTNDQTTVLPPMPRGST